LGGSESATKGATVH